VKSLPGRSLTIICLEARDLLDIDRHRRALPYCSVDLMFPVVEPGHQVWDLFKAGWRKPRFEIFLLMANVRQVFRGWSPCRLPVMPLRLFVRSGAHFAWVRHSGSPSHEPVSEFLREHQGATETAQKKKRHIFRTRGIELQHRSHQY